MVINLNVYELKMFDSFVGFVIVKLSYLVFVLIGFIKSCFDFLNPCGYTFLYKMPSF